MIDPLHHGGKVHIHIKKGLDIPIEGKPSGKVQPFFPRGEAAPDHPVKLISLNLDPFDDLRFTLRKKVDDPITIGEPIAEDKGCPGRMFVSPACGVIQEIRRGLKRRILDIVILVDHPEKSFDHGSFPLSSASREDLVEFLKKGGMFSKLRQRPFDRLADPRKKPRSIFVKALESAPFAPPAEMQVEGHEEDFQGGLDALAKLTEGNVHLVYSGNTSCKAFREANHVEHHTAEGPHPIANHSLHIQLIDPIRSAEDIVWTATALDVVQIGHLLRTGRYLTDRIVSMGGPGMVEDQTGFFRLREGYPISPLLEGRVKKGWMRFISGDVLMGKKAGSDDFLRFSDTVFSVVPENAKREFLHFFRLGTQKYSMSRAYLSGHLKDSSRLYPFTTNLHGEHRAFIDNSLYQKVMPMRIPTMFLVKAVMAEDYDLAEELGLLEVAPEDFALATFVDPSKVEMIDIMQNGLRTYSTEVLE